MAKPTFRPGQPLRASELKALTDSVTRRTVGGSGVRSQTFGDQVILASAQPIWRIRRGGGGGATIDVVQAVADGTLGAIPVKLLTLKADLSLSPNYTQAASAVTCAYFKL